MNMDYTAAGCFAVGIISLLLASMVRAPALGKLLFWIALVLTMDGLIIILYTTSGAKP